MAAPTAVGYDSTLVTCGICSSRSASSSSRPMSPFGTSTTAGVDWPNASLMASVSRATRVWLPSVDPMP